jgi:hypothetical protein
LRAKRARTAVENMGPLWYGDWEEEMDVRDESLSERMSRSPCSYRIQAILTKGVAEHGKETNTHFFFFSGLPDPPPPLPS